MSSTSAENEQNFEKAHPLAEALIAHARDHALAAPVIEIAAGRGRNTRALRAAGLAVDALDDLAPYTQLPFPRERFAAALSTHGYLHGASAKLRLGIAELRRVLRPGAAAYLTLGSISDAAYGLGEQIDERTFVPGEGDEIGVPHTYFDRDGVLETLGGFRVVRCDEVDVDALVGRWAHPASQALGRRHWFVIAVLEAHAPLAE